MRLGGRQYAKRYRTAQGRAGAGQQGEDGNSGAGAGGHVGDGHEALALGELDDQLVLLLHLRPKAMRVSMARGSLGPGRDVCQQRSLGECRSRLWGCYSLVEGVGGLRLQGST